MRKFVVPYLLIISLKGLSQTSNNEILKGNAYYIQQQYINAAQEYNRVLEVEPENTTAKFNLANAFYKQDNKVDAAQIFTGMTNSVKEKGLLSQVYYNKGVILSQQKNLEGSIEAWKMALRNDPTDMEARENLQKALQELKKKTPPPPKKKEQDKKKQKQQQKQNQSKMSPKETEQRLKLLQQKEKQVQERVQSERSKTGAGSRKDW